MAREVTNKVWIELELPVIADAGFDHSLGRERAEKASNMLRRLGLDNPHKPVWWHEKHHCYCFTVDLGGSYVEAEDHGHWFNLDYFGRAETA